MLDVAQFTLGKNSCGSYKTETRCIGTFNVPYLVPTVFPEEQKTVQHRNHSFYSATKPFVSN